MSKTLFHYTPVSSAVMILRHGIIRRSMKAPRYVWLSSNPTDEPTARRLYDRRLGRLSKARARFVFKGCDAIPWQDLPLPSEARENLVRLAEPKGGRPEEWYALADEVPCASLPLEIDEEDVGAWGSIDRDELKRQYEDVQETLTNGRLNITMSRDRLR